MLPGGETAAKRAVLAVPSRRRRRDPVRALPLFPCARSIFSASRALFSLHTPRALHIHPKSTLPTLEAGGGGGEMRQHEKLAAAAAQELLKADASRQRRAAAVQSRKGPASMRKGTATTANRKATGRAAAAAPVMRHSAGGSAAAPEVGAGFAPGGPAAVPEQNGATGFSSASPSTFSDGSCFFNGGGGNYFGNAGHSPLPQPWMFPHSADPATW